MRLAIRHKIAIAVGSGVGRAVQHLLLTPRSLATQTVLEWDVAVDGFDGAAPIRDAYGNLAHLVAQAKPAAELVITAGGLVETIDRTGVIGRLDGDPVPLLFTRLTPLTKAAGAVYAKFRSTPKSGESRIGLLHALMGRMGELYDFAADGKPAGMSQSQSMEGMSQAQTLGRPTLDAAGFAHGFIGAARVLDIPARYVTGYLEGSERLHAWAEAWDDNLGWIAFDPALDVCPTESHVRLAVGLDAATTAPVRSVPAVGEPALLELSVTPA